MLNIIINMKIDYNHYLCLSLKSVLLFMIQLLLMWCLSIK